MSWYKSFKNINTGKASKSNNVRIDIGDGRCPGKGGMPSCFYCLFTVHLLSGNVDN